MGELSIDALLTLVAIGWVDGELHEREAAAILAVARAQGHDEADVQRLVDAFDAPLSLEDPGAMPRPERLFLYGLARWIVQVDGVITREERNVMDAVAMALRIGATGRREVDRIVDAVAEASGTEPDRFDVAALRQGITDLLAT